MPEFGELSPGQPRWKITGDITIEFLEAAVERMFNADEVSSVVDLAKLKELNHRIVISFFTQMTVDEITGGIKFRRGN
jgi:hypothetical protein